MTGMVGGLMTMTGHHKTFFTLFFLAFGIQFILNIILIPLLGIVGRNCRFSGFSLIVTCTDTALEEPLTATASSIFNRGMAED